MAITPLQPEIQDYLNGLCCVSAVLPSFSYNSGYMWQVGTSVNACPTISAGTTPITFSVSPSLPAGLSIDSNTGCISGTPTEDINATLFTITGTNSAGSTTFGTQILISPASVGNPPQIDYDTAPFTFELGVAVNECPSVSGDLPITFSISPSLPAGLSIDSTTGCITGTPTTVTTSDTYEVQAVNAGGSATASLIIEVIDQFITITNGGFGTAIAAQTYLDLYSTTYTDFSYDITNDIMSWKEPVNTSYTSNSFMASGINGLSSSATFSDQKGLITSFLGIGSFNSISTNHTFTNNITFGNNTFNNTASNVMFTFGNNCSFGERSLSSFVGTNNTINFGDNTSFNSTTDPNLDALENSTVNFGSINNITNKLGVSTDCTYNFNGDLGGSTGADFTNTDWIDITSLNLTINARVTDETSNGGGIEGDLDNLINNGATVNFIL